jgi:DNA-binding transcriptional MerR regulator
MKKYSIGQVSKILDLKPHVIRYWEKEFSFLSPVKNFSGRRLYSIRELKLLFRLKHLLYNKRYTIEGAKKRIWDETTGAGHDINLKIHELRDQLFILLAKLKNK